MKCQLIILLTLTLPSVPRAEVRPNSLFADNAVFQRGHEIPVWGTARDGETVTVAFGGQRISTVAKGGQWKVRCKAMQCNSIPRTMVIAGDNIITLTNILIGDVWVASGQSNMERQLGPRERQKPIQNWEAEVAAANYPQIREYHVPEHFAFALAKDANGCWTACSPETVKDFSAVAYFFARDVYLAEKVPIGILFTAVGGTPTESWTSAKSLGTMADFKNDVKLMLQLRSGSISAEAFFREEIARWYTKYDLSSARHSGGVALDYKPAFPRRPDDDYIGVTVLYNAMIAPLQSFPIKGVIWYQGESNNDRAEQYRKLFPLLISDWRRGWLCGTFPFLFVQVASYRDMKPELREAQFLTLKSSPNTAMAVITDAGDADDIHPARKQAPGERLALAARALAYGEKLEYSGPLFDSVKIIGGKAVISFTHIGDGLAVKGAGLKGFTIASTDKNFVPAKAEIQGKTVLVWSDQVPKPRAVRYGWSNVPDVNLFNKEDLPASPFRTENGQEP